MNLLHGVDLDQASKFDKRYGKKSSVLRSRIPFISSRKPIATIDCFGGTKNIYLHLSTKLEKQVAYFHKQLYGAYAVHVDEDMTYIKNILVQIANSQNTTTIVHLHGALAQKHGFLPLTARFIYVWDERQKEKLIKWGLGADRIVVEGYARRYWRYYGVSYSKNRAFWCEKLHLDPMRPILLVAPYNVSDCEDGGRNTIERSVEMIKEAVDKVKMQTVIKLHPSATKEEDKIAWDNWKLCRPWAMVVHKAEPFLLLLACDKLIAHNSTYAIDAYAFGKSRSTIVIDDGMPSGYEEFLDEFTVARKSEDIVEALRTAN